VQEYSPQVGTVSPHTLLAAFQPQRFAGSNLLHAASSVTDEHMQLPSTMQGHPFKASHLTQMFGF
jgi:hypothetical protein